MEPPSGSPDLVLAFANTHADGGGRPERFADVDGLRAWLRENGLDEAADDASPADVDGVRHLRDAVVTVLLGHSHDPATDDATVAAAEDDVRRVAARHPLVTSVDRDGARLAPAQPGLPGALGLVLAAMTELALTGSWSRVKACRNPPCHFAFLDRSRNTSGAYCSTACSSQVAMRAYRRRKAGSHD
ncbi:CGNR zinc finger domain-containing protein [Actinomycetospora atypica]|uniref:CGNR zinc finger domain-containing protein n=1 Tax=Actinomycetospora atypica TaxID=1290095 RepID=A0ABV9YNW0_9PSEU